MISFNSHEEEEINEGRKTSTLRAIRPSGKGYFHEGSLQKFCRGRDFKNGIFNRALILRRSFVDIEELTEEDFQTLGYSSKAEYMAQPYNQSNPSSQRVRYDFITLSDLGDFVASLEWTPSTFATVWEMVGNCKELAQGVNPALIFEGCDLEDLEEAFLTIQCNIEEAKI